MVVERAGSLDAITGAGVRRRTPRRRCRHFRHSRNSEYIGMAIANMASLVDPEIISCRWRRRRRAALQPFGADTRAGPAWSRTKAGVCVFGFGRARRRHRARAARDGGGLMTVLSGADVVLPHRLLSPGTIVLEGTRITDVTQGLMGGGGDARLDLTNHYIVPGFIDVHGLDGLDTLSGKRRRDRGNGAALSGGYGVTAFCPTTIACGPTRCGGCSIRSVRRRETPAPCAPACCRRISKAISSTPNTRVRSLSHCLPPRGGGARRGSSPVGGDSSLRLPRVPMFGTARLRRARRGAGFRSFAHRVPRASRVARPLGRLTSRRWPAWTPEHGRRRTCSTA